MALMHQIVDALLDLLAASYHAETLRPTDASDEDRWLVVRTRGGETRYPDEDTRAFIHRKAEGPVWYSSGQAAAENAAASYQRSLSARRRAIIVFVGWATAIFLRVFAGPVLC